MGFEKSEEEERAVDIERAQLPVKMRTSDEHHQSEHDAEAGRESTRHHQDESGGIERVKPGHAGRA